MILALVDHDRGKLNELSLQMVTLARQLAARANTSVEAILVGAEARPLAERLQAFGVSVVHLAQHDDLGDYAPGAWAQSTIAVISAASPDAILAPGSERGNEVLAHVAARLSLPLATNCTAVELGETCRLTRMRWGGSLLEEATLSGTPKLLTVAPHAVAAEAAPSPALTVRELVPLLTDNDVRVRVGARVAPSRDAISLAEARVVVGGGRGVGGAEEFAVLEELAALLKGAVGCSRAVTSLGWRPHSDQIGQTGARIAPDLYIACGVSGAIQHMVGCKGAKHILAINTDPEANIVTSADCAVIGDLHEVVPAIVAELKKARG
jgi:electron transfer flavoprotein alpha subunit